MCVLLAVSSFCVLFCAQESLIKKLNVSPSLLYFQRCFPLNKGEEWLKPEYSQEPKVIFAKTKVQAER